MAPAIGVNIVRNASILKGAIGTKAKIVLTGHNSVGSGTLSKAIISQCDGGITGSALAFGGASIWKGVGLAGVGVGLIVAELTPVMVLAVGGAATSIVLFEYFKRRAKRRLGPR